MSPTITYPITPNITRTRGPGVQEFGAILNLLPEASLLLDRSSGLIIQVNSALLKITAYSQDELSGNSIDQLIPDSGVENILPGNERSFFMNRRNRNPISVIVQASYVDADNQWLMLTLIPLQKRQSLLQKQEKLFQGLFDLAKFTEPPDLDQCFEKALLLTQSLIETNLVCLYQTDYENPQLTKIASIESVINFPNIIPSIDLTRLAKLSVWTPGRRVLTEIHRTGRVENLSFVASVPIGQEGALFGLLVVGDKDYQPDEQQVRLLEVMGVHITSALLHYILIGNLGRKFKSQEKLIAVRDDLFENCQDGIMVLYPELRIQKINPSAELMLGYADIEVGDQQVENILIGADGLSSALEAARHNIATHDLGSVHLHRRNGQSFPARIQVLPSQRGENLNAILVFITDVSENEQIRVRTQQLEHRALLGEFTAVFAHEVRNPINNISTGLQLMATRLSGDDPNQDIITRMREDCLRLDHLMESVLSFSRTNETRFEPIVLDIMLQRILDRWRPRLPNIYQKSWAMQEL
jgi:two-component system sensor histidine kinase AtoS